MRIARLSLAEKAVEYELVPVDIFAREGAPPGYLDRHPFGRIPAFEHEGFSLYETGAIARYIDEAFEGPPMQPADLRERARCNQLISIADNYAYPQLVWGIYVERVSKPGRGAVADEAKIAAAIPKARACLKAISDLMGDNPLARRTAIDPCRSLHGCNVRLLPDGAGRKGHDPAIQKPGGMVVSHRGSAIDDEDLAKLDDQFHETDRSRCVEHGGVQRSRPQ